jgi:tRNA/tmRNA/rRNA uracil-C5-methylase (TrmA/RlmC/RlmD family)
MRVTGSGFWQVHPAAAATLVDAVLEAAEARAGETVVDLYAGVGLFTSFLADAVGERGSVVSVESDGAATRDARRNLHDRPQVRLVGATVEHALRSGQVPSADLVVLDPPRTGAKRAVAGIAALTPRRVVYVACDPAALARDLATFADLGYRLDRLRAFALFPMTHHVECVATLVPL